jgi:exoribonuclease R
VNVAQQGHTYKGTISGVTEYGIYIEEEATKSDGMVHVRNMPMDNYIYDEKNYSLRGERTKVKYTLGDQVQFRVVGGDADKRTLDYALVPSTTSANV